MTIPARVVSTPSTGSGQRRRKTTGAQASRSGSSGRPPPPGPADRVITVSRRPPAAAASRMVASNWLSAAPAGNQRLPATPGLGARRSVVTQLS